MLYCEAGPPFGGETGFADTYATFQGLSEKDRDFLRGKTCIHDFDAFRFQQGRSGVSEETVEELRTSYSTRLRGTRWSAPTRTRPWMAGAVLVAVVNCEGELRIAARTPAPAASGRCSSAIPPAQRNFSLELFCRH